MLILEFSGNQSSEDDPEVEVENKYIDTKEAFEEQEKDPKEIIADFETVINIESTQLDTKGKW